MRFLRLLGTLALAGAYGRGAFYFYEQEEWAQSHAGAPKAPAHPEGLMAGARDAFLDNNFSDAVGLTIQNALGQAPSSFQPPFLLGVFHASRLEEPERAREAFRAAVRRYPANGRLRLEHARFLFGGGSDARASAEQELRAALELEPELTTSGVALLRDHGVPWERWQDVLPPSMRAREEMVHALVDEGRTAEALSMLRQWVAAPEARTVLPRAARWAITWGDPALAVEIATRWESAETGDTLLGAKPYEAALVKASAQLQMGDVDAAHKTFRRALHATEERFGAGSVATLELLCAMGQEYLNRNHALLAQSLFAEAATLSPRYAPAALGLARAYRRKGDVASAILHYRLAIELDPGIDAAREELEPLLLTGR